jgi:hypothetical protein
MATEDSRKERTRAWVLVRAAEGKEEEAARSILALTEELRELYPDGVNFVVRADLVAGLGDTPYNIVAPVDLESEGVLHGLLRRIRGVPGVEDQVTALVELHIPYPPHRTLGYVTEEEAEDDPKKEEETQPGLRGNSPGENPWG